MHWLATLKMDSLVATVLDLIVPDRTTWSSPDGTNNTEPCLIVLVLWVLNPSSFDCRERDDLWWDDLSRVSQSTAIFHHQGLGRDEQANVVPSSRINALRDGPWPAEVERTHGTPEAQEWHRTPRGHIVPLAWMCMACVGAWVARSLAELAFYKYTHLHNYYFDDRRLWFSCCALLQHLRCEQSAPQMHLSTAMRAVCTVLARKKRASYTFSCQDILCEHLTGPSREKKYSYLVHYIYVCVIYIYTYICMYNVIYIHIWSRNLYYISLPGWCGRMCFWAWYILLI